MADHLHVIKNESPPSVGGFVLTDTASDILRSLTMAHRNFGTLTMIAGVPGVGKSKAVQHYCRTHPQPRSVWTHKMVAGEGKIWDLSVGLMEVLDIGAPNSRRMREERFRIAEAIGVESLLIIDEAQYLANYNPRGGFNYDALEWLRALAEEGGFSVAFCGDLALHEVVQAVPQLRRRIIRPVVVRTLPKSDVAKVAKQHGVYGDVMVDALTAVARRYGGLADVVNVLRHAALLDGKAVSPKSLQAAIHDLKLAPTGGQS